MTRLDVGLVALGTSLLIFSGFGAAYVVLKLPSGSTVISGAIPLISEEDLK